MSTLILTTILSILIALERYDPVDKGETDELCKLMIHIKNLVFETIIIKKISIFLLVAFKGANIFDKYQSPMD